jgi:hypothetical protein
MALAGHFFDFDLKFVQHLLISDRRVAVRSTARLDGALKRAHAGTKLAVVASRIRPTRLDDLLADRMLARHRTDVE